jgi:hypothetical protein
MLGGAADCRYASLVRALLDRGVRFRQRWYLTHTLREVRVLAVECGVLAPYSQDQWRNRETDEFVEAWRAGTHPVQLERAAVEQSLLSASLEMPEAVARAVGDYVHARERRLSDIVE